MQMGRLEKLSFCSRDENITSFNLLDHWGEG